MAQANRYSLPMDSLALKAFMAVAQQGSFSRAADELFLTQPAVSKRIVKLENQLKTRLFDRIGRNVSLTIAGQHLLPKAKACLLYTSPSPRDS